MCIKALILIVVMHIEMTLLNKKISNIGQKYMMKSKENGYNSIQLLMKYFLSSKFC